MFTIDQVDKPHIGKTIRYLRECKGVSQEELARTAFFNRTTLSFIESGIQDCPDDILTSIKSALDLDGLPLYEHERPAFREMLHGWYNIISERNFDEAKKLRAKLSIIQLLPQDTELNDSFSLFDCRLCLGLNELDAAKEILDAFEVKLDELSDIQRYHYLYNQGTYNIKKHQYEIALEYYLKTHELIKRGLEKNISLYYNIALCYGRLGYVARAIMFLEEACVLPTFGCNNVPEFNIYNSLGLNYARTGHHQRAKAILGKAHAIALNDYNASRSETNKRNLCLVLINLGYMYRLAGKWNRAIEYLDNAAKYTAKENANYLEILYQKTRCLIEMGNPLSCSSLLSEGLSLSKGDKAYFAAFEALKILISLNEESAKQLETKILSYLVENNFYLPALDFASVLRDFYKTRRGFKTRALEMADIICTIQIKMRKGGVIE